MFFAFHWFDKPKVFNVAQTSVLDWVRSQEVNIFLDSAGEINVPATFEKRRLSEDELVQLEVLSECAWLESDYGGYTTDAFIGDINGFCHFELNESRQRIQLLAMVAQEDTPPLQSPVLHATLATLMRELRYIEKVYLPFFEFGPEDAEALDSLNLGPDEQPGWWRRIYRIKPEPTSLTPGALKSLVSCLELRVTVKPQSVDFVNRELGRVGYDEHTFIDWTSSDGVTDDTRIVRSYIPYDDKAEATIEKVRRVLAKLGKFGPGGDLEVVGRSSSEWLNIRAQIYPTVHIGKHFVVKPPTQNYAPKPDEVVIEIVPTPEVFGYFYSGFHASTELCLELLEKYVEPKVQQKALDLGTGTGLQAIAAAQLGIGQILAVDAYMLAVEAARDNVARNNLSDKITVEYGSLGVVNNQRQRGLYSFTEDAQRPPTQLAEMLPFDLIISNIIARGLIGLAQTLAESLRPGGMLITSGISADREEDVTAALQTAGLLIIERRHRSGWVGLAAIRR